MGYRDPFEPLDIWILGSGRFFVLDLSMTSFNAMVHRIPRAVHLQVSTIAGPFIST